MKKTRLKAQSKRNQKARELVLNSKIVHIKQAYYPYKGQQTELGKLSPFLKNTQKSRQLTQSVVAGVMHL
jgi:hypothetical protein